ncbi:MAG TPA: sigma-70 family RNA polymerase sigma factor [Labilithrix sp.]|jgi:RNA polymerase sigma-70 factor (ECF subfamily)|nr:sigma-70 family RNA polymerase sigma factor [Labilithrix sp.]
MHPDDQTVVAALLAGDEKTFAELVTRLHGRLVRLACRVVGEEAAAEDVAQETWRRVARALSGFDGKSRLDTWITAILLNRARTRAAKDRREVMLSDAHDPFEHRFVLGQWRPPPAVWPAVATPESDLADKEMLALVARALDELPERQRLLVTLRDVEGVDASTACALLDISEENQRVLLHRGRANLRDVVERLLGERTRGKIDRVPA